MQITNVFVDATNSTFAHFVRLAQALVKEGAMDGTQREEFNGV